MHHHCTFILQPRTLSVYWHRVPGLPPHPPPLSLNCHAFSSLIFLFIRLSPLSTGLPFLLLSSSPSPIDFTFITLPPSPTPSLSPCFPPPPHLPPPPAASFLLLPPSNGSLPVPPPLRPTSALAPSFTSMNSKPSSERKQETKLGIKPWRFESDCNLR